VGCCRRHPSTSFTTGTRPVGSIRRQTLRGVLSSAPLNLLHHRHKTGGIDWLRQTLCGGGAVRSTQLPSPPARGRWDRQGKCGRRPPTSRRWRQTLSGGGAVRSTQLASPPARDRWDRQGKCGSRLPTLRRWGQTLSGVLPSAPLNLLHHRHETGGIDRASVAAARRPCVGGGKR